jgi:hypothetical protein
MPREFDTYFLKWFLNFVYYEEMLLNGRVYKNVSKSIQIFLEATALQCMRN